MTDFMVHNNNDFHSKKGLIATGGFHVKSRKNGKEKLKFTTVKTLIKIKDIKIERGFLERFGFWPSLWALSGVTILPVIGFGIAFACMKPKIEESVEFECQFDDGRTLNGTVNPKKFETLQNEMYALYGDIEGDKKASSNKEV